GGGGYGGQAAWVWTAAQGMQVLLLPGAANSIPDRISRDGTTVVGEAFGGGAPVRGFVWTAASGLQEIEPIEGFDGAYALAASVDGSTVTGGYTGASGDLGFRW